MDVAQLEVDRDEALRMWRKYQTHKHHQNPIDQDVERIYRAIATGKVVIRALESIRKAGLFPSGLPKLAIARADAKSCFLTLRRDGSAQMADLRWINRNTARNRYVDFEAGTFGTGIRGGSFTALVPHIPPDLRPKRGIQNYTILWEAEWSPEPPRDPLLLRRFGKGDIWLVCGAWDLTEVERAVMADRMRATRN